MSEEELRKEAVRRRLAGERPDEIGAALGRTSRWVRKWVARYEEGEGGEDRWAQGRSRAPHSSPTRTPDVMVNQILAARERLVANPRAQYGSLAIQWELRRLGVEVGAQNERLEPRAVGRGGGREGGLDLRRHGADGQHAELLDARGGVEVRGAGGRGSARAAWPRGCGAWRLCFDPCCAGSGSGQRPVAPSRTTRTAGRASGCSRSTPRRARRG